LWDATTGKRVQKTYENSNLETTLARLFKQNWQVPVPESKVHQGLSKAYKNIKEPGDFVNFLKDVQEYAMGVIPKKIKERCNDRLVISMKLFPAFVGAFCHTKVHVVNRLEDYPLVETDASKQMWSTIMQQIGNDPEVAAVHLQRADETARELSNWHRFQSVDKKTHKDPNHVFNCDLKRPRTAYDQLAKKHSGATVIETNDCWADSDASNKCLKKALKAAGFPAENAKDFNMTLFGAAHQNGAGTHAGGKGRGEVTCDGGGWRCFSSSGHEVQECDEPNEHQWSDASSLIKYDSWKHNGEPKPPNGEDEWDHAYITR